MDQQPASDRVGVAQAESGKRKAERGALGVALLVMALAVGFWVSCFLAAAIFRWAQGAEGLWQGTLVAAGPDKIMRRIVMVWAFAALAVFLKRMGWRGWKDCGFTADPERETGTPGWRLFLGGLGLGILTLGAIGLATVTMKIRYFAPDGGVVSALQLFRYFLVALSVALLEETLCRGMLFRALARAWRAWPAALVISLGFALAHFLSPDPAAFTQGSVWQASGAALASLGRTLSAQPHFLLRFINLTLLGLLLCAFVTRTGSIWKGVGAHAGWVWVIKALAYLTDVPEEAPWSCWLGDRSDMTDSLLATVVISAWLLVTLMRRPEIVVVLRAGGLRWRVAPPETGRFRIWAETWLCGDRIREGRVLKEYARCRIVAAGGMVFKQYSRPSVLGRIRRSFCASRTRHAFVLGRRLCRMGISTPEPVAWASRRFLGIAQSEYLVTREVEQAEALTALLETERNHDAFGRLLMARYGRLMADFHRNGFSNRDFKHENVLVRREPLILWVVDLDGVRFWGRVSRRRAGRDLRRVGLSLASIGWTRPPDVEAFFAAYNERVPDRLRRTAFPS